MSLVFASQEKDVIAKAQNIIPKTTVQKLLDENTQLIKTITEYQNGGLVDDAAKLQQLLHRNLVYLASATDVQQGDIPEPVSGSLSALTNEDFLPPAPPMEQTHQQTNGITHNDNQQSELPIASAAPSALQQQLQQGTASSTQQYNPYAQQQNMPPPNVYPHYNQGPPPGAVYAQGPPRVSMYQPAPGAPPSGHQQQQQYAPMPQQYPAVVSNAYPPHPVYTSNN